MMIYNERKRCKEKFRRSISYKFIRLFITLALLNAALLTGAAITYRTPWEKVPTFIAAIANFPSFMISLAIFGDEQDERFGIPLEFAINWCLSLPWIALAAYGWSTIQRRSLNNQS